MDREKKNEEIAHEEIAHPRRWWVVSSQTWVFLAI